MKIYLIDPNKKWQKANLHCHTNNSDGFYSPEEIKKYYMAQGYSVVAYTDHELIYDNSNLCDENFIAVTASEFSIVEERNWRDAKAIHFSLFAKDPHNILHPATKLEDINPYFKNKYKGEIKCDGYHREYTKESIQELINLANKKGFLVQLNHPSWSLLTKEDYIDLKGLWSLEVLNYLTEIETGTEYCINIYEDMLRNGTKLNCTMGDDNHNYNGGFEGSFGAYNYIGVDKLTYSEIIKAMENGNIYATNGPVIKSLYFDTELNKLYIECSNATDIILTGKNRVSRHYHGDNLTYCEFDVYESDVYFRVTIKDMYGKVAHTHAYYLDDYDFKFR